MSRVRSRINVMRKFKYTLDRKSLETIYIAFIRPILEYADVVWDNCTQHEKHDLEGTQLEVARIATGTTKLVSVQKLYDEIGWETLDESRRKHKLVLFYKMYNDIAPSYLSSLVPRPDQNVTVCVTQIILEQSILALVSIIILFFLQSFVIGTLFPALTE